MANKSENQACINGSPTSCGECRDPICLRQQTINLALGNVDEMLCLRCLGKGYQREPAEVLEGVRAYIMSRPCFKNEWVKYRQESDCSARETCYPGVCVREDYEED